jgi:hypothetical protein
MLEALLRTDSRFLAGITRERLERERSVHLNIAPAGEPYLPFAAGGFGTPQRRAADMRWSKESAGRRGVNFSDI